LLRKHERMDGRRAFLCFFFLLFSGALPME
jgi:hypothetical protein